MVLQVGDVVNRGKLGVCKNSVLVFFFLYIAASSADYAKDPPSQDLKTPISWPSLERLFGKGDPSEILEQENVVHEPLLCLEG